MNDPQAGELPQYQVYGLTLASDVPFRTPLPPGRRMPDFHLVRSTEPFGLPASLPIYTSTRMSPQGRSVLTIAREGDTDTLLLADDTCFRLRSSRIEYYAPPTAHPATLEIFILGTLLTYLLECRGVPVLHAATVEVAGRAVAFLAGNRGGKSSLAAGFLLQGAPLLSDDLLPLAKESGGYRAPSGYPQMRFWPDQARAFAPDVTALDRVHPDLEKLRVPVGPTGFGRFSPNGAPLAAVYIPDRTPSAEPAPPVEIVPLTAREAVVALSRELFLQRVLEKLGLMGERLAFLATLVRTVPVRRLRYPSGVEHLPAVVAAVRADQESHP